MYGGYEWLQLNLTGQVGNKEPPTNTYSSFTIGGHKLPERCVSFDFELDDGIVLSENFQVDVFGFATLKNKQKRRVGYPGIVTFGESNTHGVCPQTTDFYGGLPSFRRPFRLCGCGISFGNGKTAWIR